MHLDPCLRDNITASILHWICGCIECVLLVVICCHGADCFEGEMRQTLKVKKGRHMIPHHSPSCYLSARPRNSWTTWCRQVVQQWLIQLDWRNTIELC